MAVEDFRTTLRIEEVEGAVRWSATLQGRAMPKTDQAPTFGVDPQSETTWYRGQGAGRTEPLGLQFPVLSFAGTWRIIRFTTGDARIDSSPSRVRTPQEACDFFEAFASRQKVVDVTWSGGVLRRCSWGSFHFSPGRGGDRDWSMTFQPLARGATRSTEVQSTLEPRTMLAGLRRAARDLDLALAEAFIGSNATFLDRLRTTMGNVRAKSAALRKEIAAAGSFARLPTDTLRELDRTASDFRATYQAAMDEYDQTAWEYQVAQSDSATLRAARTFKGSVTAALDDQWAFVADLIALLQKRKVDPLRYVAVHEGDLLPRIAARELGSADAWTTIADANGILGQTVPAGVARIVIPRP